MPALDIERLHSNPSDRKIQVPALDIERIHNNPPNKYFIWYYLQLGVYV